MTTNSSNFTVPIRKNLIGNACQNVLCHRSARIPVPVLYPFGICSVSVLYLFRSHSHTCSVSVLYPFANTFPVRFLLIGTVYFRSAKRKCKKGREKSCHCPKNMYKYYKYNMKLKMRSNSIQY